MNSNEYGLPMADVSGACFSAGAGLRVTLPDGRVVRDTTYLEGWRGEGGTTVTVEYKSNGKKVELRVSSSDFAHLESMAK